MPERRDRTPQQPNRKTALIRRCTIWLSPCARWRGDSLEVRFFGRGSRTAQRFGIAASHSPYIFRVAIPSAIRKSDILPLRKRNTTNDGRPCRIRKRTGLFAFSTAKGHSEVDYRESMLVPQTLRGAYNCNSSCIPAAKSACWLRKQSPFRSVPSRCPIRSIRPLRACCHFRWPP